MNCSTFVLVKSLEKLLENVFIEFIFLSKIVHGVLHKFSAFILVEALRVIFIIILPNLLDHVFDFLIFKMIPLKINYPVKVVSFNFDLIHHRNVFWITASNFTLILLRTVPEFIDARFNALKGGKKILDQNVF